LSRHAGFWVAGATVLVLLPFLGKPFHIDDPLFVWAAKQIAAHPLDPYGFRVNWSLAEQPMYDVTKNPPLACYLLAAGGSVLGWSEAALHAVMLLPAVLAATGTFALARRLTGRPSIAAACVLCAPVFVLAASSVMCDTLMLALWVWAVVIWHDGLERDDVRRLVAAMALASAAALTKYFGMAVVPLLAAYALARRAPVARWAAPIAIPILALGVYHGWTRSLYGRGLLLDAAAYASDWKARHELPFWGRGLTGLVFAGGCALPALTLAPVVWSRRALAACAGAGLVVGAAVGSRASIGAQAGLFAIGGASLVALAAADLVERREAASWLLALWVGGVFVFAAFVNWTVNGRSILPVVPAAGILLARRLERRAAVSSSSVAVLLAISALLALAAGAADFRLASAQREAADVVAARTRGTPVWFEGHWGFQYYMEAMGARAIDVRAFTAARGDVVVLPLDNTRVAGLPRGAAGATDDFEVATFPWMSTMQRRTGAGFYASSFGPLPFAVGPVPSQRYSIVTLN
jgi:4-amino-4-deoxy-L-arabinose transferase-like glycosyltransferase